MKVWINIGVLATIIIILIIPLQFIKYYYFQDKSSILNDGRPVFAGGASCIECHQLEYDLWHGSHHDRAMEVATAESVLGNFDSTVFSHNGIESIFFRKGDQFFVKTEGAEGKMEDFQVSHTFGFNPLQQYLIPFENGKFQCLPIAWDTEKKEWYHLFDMVYEGQDIKPDDWLYWTNLGQNWNGMCAECHSTHLRKNLNPLTMAYNTTWVDIDVNCESCHGPGSAHNEWANLPELSRPMDNNFGLVIRTRDIGNRAYVDLCTRCHSRKQSLNDFDHFQSDLMDTYIPQVVDGPYYHNDGQILEEDYVYGSFVQSKMYMNDVMCNDCHNVHSLELVEQGNSLCLQCHLSDHYDTYSHHFHKYPGEEGDPVTGAGKIYEVGTGSECINCHMMGQYYMGIDYRRDHSFRIPRPDLTLEIGSPNACNDCHSDQTADWVMKYITEWYGKSTKSHYGSFFARAQEADPAVLHELIRIANDDLFPEIIRATSVSLIGNYSDSAAFKAIEKLLTDPEPIVRYYAVRHLPATSIEQVKSALISLLYDPVKAVRIEAAAYLAILPREELDATKRELLSDVLEEYTEAMYYTADFSPSRHNLGNLYSNRGDVNQSISNYVKAIEIDALFFPAKVNLAMIYNSTGENEKAEVLLREVVSQYPDNYDIYYSLGLLLAEMGKYEESVDWLSRAGEQLPDRARIFYNLGLILEYLQQPSEAEEALLHAYELEPYNQQFIYALAQFYTNLGKQEEGRKFTDLLQ